MKFTRNDPKLKQRRQELRHNQTEAEKVFWTHVRNRQLYGLRFFRQYSVGSYILDFYCPVLKLAIALDGGQHTEEDSKEYDAARSAYLRTQGIDVMRFWNHDVLHDTEGMLAQLVERLNFSAPPLRLRGGLVGLLKGRQRE